MKHNGRLVRDEPKKVQHWLWFRLVSFYSVGFDLGPNSAFDEEQSRVRHFRAVCGDMSKAKNEIKKSARRLQSCTFSKTETGTD